MKSRSCYLCHSDWNTCPKCGSDDTEETQEYGSGPEIEKETVCHNCEASWRTYFKPTKIEMSADGYFEPEEETS